VIGEHEYKTRLIKIRSIKPGRSKMKAQKKLTTAAGAPVVDNQNTMTAGPRGPVLLQDT
jgi:catalase